VNDFKEPNGTMKKIINKHRSDFFQTSRAGAVNPNTNRSPIQLNLVNPVNNTQVGDPGANIASYRSKEDSNVQMQ
jgi:hypothetical protein